MQVQLIVKDKNREGRAIPVDVPAFRIGQTENCHLRSSSARISPLHCVLYTHDSIVTIQDLGGEYGTYVNGTRVSTRQELKDGDELAVGNHTFVMSIKTGTAQPAVNPSESFAPAVHTEPEAELMFEIRHKGQNVSVTKKRLFEMARKGTVSPDDIIIVAGTKVFADSIQGIIFGNESPAVNVSAPEPFEFYKMETNTAAPPDAPATNVPVVDDSIESSPFGIADEPSVPIQRGPGVKKKNVTFSDLGKDLGKPLEEPLGRVSTWMNNNITSRHVKMYGSVLVALFLLGILAFWLMPDKKSLYGAVRIVGTLTLDGNPVEGAGVILYPRDKENQENGYAAYGTTDKRGNFTVTTGEDPIGRGAVPGEYDVTFRMQPRIPKYEQPETSGLAPIRVETKARQWFPFELTSTASPLPKSGTETGNTPQLPKPEVEPENVPPPVPDNSVPPYQPTVPNIWAAAERGTVQDVEYYISNGANINERRNGDTLLHRAARNNSNVDVLNFLVAQGAGINVVNNVGDTPLHLAARYNANVDVLNYLVQKADVNTKNNAGQTPLDVARLDSVRADEKGRILRARGAESGVTPPQPPSQADKPPPLPPRTFTDIFEAASRGTEREVQTFLAENRVNLAITNGQGKTPLHLAVQHNSDAGVVRLLLERNAGVVGVRCNTGQTPLHDAARDSTNVLVLQYLVSKGADVNSLDRNNGQTPLHRAVTSNSSVKVLEFFINNGASINLRDVHGDTPLHLAVRFNSDEVLQYLVSRRDKQIEINPRNKNGETPLDNAHTEEKQRILRTAGGKLSREL